MAVHNGTGLISQECLYLTVMLQLIYFQNVISGNDCLKCFF
ncbi:hypothetical protein SD1617_2900 [Shigella dysenteriae 1617]|nr:hypothetical protein SD1617_2900 [Shigella dysenteriae 1617]